VVLYELLHVFVASFSCRKSRGLVIVSGFLVTAVEGTLFSAVLSGFIVLEYVEVGAPNGRIHKPATHVAYDMKKNGVNCGHGPQVELVWR